MLDLCPARLENNESHVLDEKDRDLLVELRHLFTAGGKQNKTKEKGGEEKRSSLVQYDVPDMFPPSRFNLRYNKEPGNSDKMPDLKRKFRNGDMLPPVDKSPAPSVSPPINQKNPRTSVEEFIDIKREAPKFPFPPRVSFFNYNNPTPDGVQVNGKKLDGAVAWTTNERSFLRLRERMQRNKPKPRATKEKDAILKLCKKPRPRPEQYTPVSIKMKDIDVAFNVRKKIEQFKSWHEDEYKRKLEVLRGEKKEGLLESRTSLNLTKPDFEPTKNIVNGNEKTHERSHTPVSKPDEEAEHVVDPPTRVQLTNQLQEGVDRKKIMTSRSERPPSVKHELERKPETAPTRQLTLQRQSSAVTWRTWRDVNESYCYDDVKKYIIDNELMSAEKEMRIKRWVMDVDRAMETDDNISRNLDSESVRETKTPASLFPPIGGRTSSTDIE